MFACLRNAHADAAALSAAYAGSKVPASDVDSEPLFPSTDALFAFLCETEPELAPSNADATSASLSTASKAARKELDKSFSRLAVCDGASLLDVERNDGGASAPRSSDVATHVAAQALRASLIARTAVASAAATSPSITRANQSQSLLQKTKAAAESALLAEAFPVVPNEARADAFAKALESLRALAPLDVLLPTSADTHALVAHQQHAATTANGAAPDDKEAEEEAEEEEPHPRAASKGNDAWQPASGKRQRDETAATRVSPAAASSPQEPTRHRSASRSPPPPALRNQSKNSFSFKVRVASTHDERDGALRGGRARSPLPPRSTAVDVDVDGESKPTSQQPAPTPMVNRAPPPPPPNLATLRQTTLPFAQAVNPPLDPSSTASTAVPSAAALGFHYGPGRQSEDTNAVNRNKKRYAPGGYRDELYSSSTGAMEEAPRPPGAGPSRSYFGQGGRSAANLSPPAGTGGSSSGYGNVSHNAASAPPPPPPPPGGFVSAGEQLLTDIKAGRASAITSSYVSHRSPALGLRRGGFQSPFQHQQQQQQQQQDGNSSGFNDSTGDVPGQVSVNRVLKAIAGPQTSKSGSGGPTKDAGATRKPKPSGDDGDDGDALGDPDQYPASLLNPDGTVPDILKPLDPKLVSQVAMEILEGGAGARSVGWDDIAGLEHAKSSVEEAIIWPLKRPDLFVGLRDPPRGLLLFGPPGTGKTMIARAIANRAGCTFMNISSSSLMSKWMGDGEKLVRCMFAVATVKQPSVIFIDEIDSLLSMRGDGEQDSVRRVKTEFLVQLDGVATDRGDRVLLIGATNRPDELDEAARRRMEKRLYIPLPDASARRVLVERLLASLTPKVPGGGGDSVGTEWKAHSLCPDDFAFIVESTEGYSGADLKQLCSEAAVGPLRKMTAQQLSEVKVHDIRPVDRRDFKQALRRIKPSVGAGEVQRYVEWNSQYGSFAEGDGVDDDDDEDDSSITGSNDGRV